MKTIILIILVIALSACQTITDGEGNVIMKSSGVARNGHVDLQFESDFDKPLTTNIISLAGKGIRPYLVPGMKNIKLKKTFSSESNVGDALSGLSQVMGAAASMSPL